MFDRPAGSERDLGVLRRQRFTWHHEPPVSTWIDAVTASAEHGDPHVLVLRSGAVLGRSHD